MSMLSIVIVVHKAIDEVELCLNSINKSSFTDFEVNIVINDGIEENYLYLKASLSKFKFKSHLIKSENLGFAHGCNIGIKYSNTNKILLLNGDCIISEKTLEELIKFGFLNEKSLIGSPIYYPDGRLQCYGGGVLNFKFGYQKLIGINDLSPDFSKLKKINLDYISGACLFFDRNIIKQLGYLPEDYFLYWEETDFCKNAVHQGFNLSVCENSYVIHSVGASTDITSPLTDYYSTRNGIHFFKKYSSKGTFLFIVIVNVISKFSNRIRRGDFYKLRVVSKAIIDGILGSRGKINN
jgi:hypothetical protein